MACAGAVLLLAAAGGCRAPRAEHTWLVAAEPSFWHAVTAADPDLDERLRGTVLADGRRMQVLLLSAETPREDLAERLAGARYAGVVLTALLAAEGEELAAAYPQLRFVLLPWSAPAAGSRPPPPANVTEVAFERRDAFERAGRLAAAYLTDLPVTAPAAAVAAWGLRETEAVAAFRAGVEAGGAGDGFVERRYDRARGRAAVDDNLDAAARAGAPVVYLEVGEFIEEGLRAMIRGGRRAVVSNWGRRPGFEKTVLLSVDDPAPEAIVAGIEAPAGTRVTVPSQVTWGLAAPLPAAAEGLYDATRAAPAAAGGNVTNQNDDGT